MTSAPPQAPTPRTPAGGGPIRRADRSAPLPLTPGQQRIWFLDRFVSGWPAHDELVYRLRGHVDGAALEEALNRVAARHEAIWARFTQVDGVPRQSFTPPSSGASQRLPIEVVDLRGLPASEATRRLDTLVATARTAPFDLTTGPLLRAQLVRLDPVDGVDEQVLSLVLHHIVCDGTSWAVLLHELREQYAAQLGTVQPGTAQPGGALPDREPGVDFGDYVLWSAERAAAARDHLDYWVEALRGVPRLRLPPDRLVPAERDHTGGRTIHRVLDRDLRDGVEALARRLRCTPFMLYLSAWQAMLSRHSGQLDLCVGTPTAGRPHPDLERVVGLFINVLPLRARLEDDPPFAELARRARRETLGALARQDVPYESIVQALGVRRDPTGSALFQNMIIVHTEEQPPEELLPGVIAEQVGDGDTYVTFDLVLDVWTSGEGLSLMLRTDRAMFSTETSELMLAHVENVLRAAVADPEVRLSAIPLDDAATAGRLRRLGTGPTAAAAADVVGLVREQAVRTPGATAVRCGPHRISYAELDTAATVLARRLRRAGAAPGNLVAVCLPRTTDLIVALVAVLRTGAGYVPADPADPAARRADVVAQAAPRILLTGHGVTGLPAGPWTTLQVTDTDTDTDTDTAEGGDEGRGPATPQDVAYVVFTSGSTGRPKGVAVPRSALASRVARMREGYRLRAEDQVLQFATVAFDTHVEEIWPALTSGAQLVLLPAGEQLPDLLAGPDGAGLTVLDLPTPYWHELVASGTVHWPASLRLLVLGADQVEPGAVAAWHRQAPGVPIVNSYGPTETTVIATTAVLDARDEDRRPAIGLPLADTVVHVVDPRLRPVAWGEPGELLIGGAGVALGYLGQPGLTADRFVPDPFGAPGGRLYRTGDRVRWRHDGQLEFLGRLDDQVKIRGYRVEPGEVAARLAALPGVRRSLVVVTGHQAQGRGDAVLVAYAVVDPPGEDNAGERLHRQLTELLPAYLVPSAVVVLDTLPLGPTGKVDVAALPAPVRDRREAPGRPPSSDAELLVAQVWQDVLGVPGFSVTDDFFAVGGHSLSAVRVASRLTAAIGLEVPLHTLFGRPTLGALATAVEELLLADLDGLDAGLADEPAGGAR